MLRPRKQRPQVIIYRSLHKPQDRLLAAEWLSSGFACILLLHLMSAHLLATLLAVQYA